MDILKVARDYIARGWAIFPLHTITDAGECSCGASSCPDAGKHPRGYYGLKEASNDAEKIEAWFGPSAPPSNIGVATGAVSGITIFDIDIGTGKFGAETWAEAVRDIGEPDTLIAQTGSGGMHVVFQYNSALKTCGNVIGKGVDCRNDGGYIVAPPSRHRSGRTYEWTNWGAALAVVPAELSRKRERRGRPKGSGIYSAKYTLEQVREMLEIIPSEDRDLWRSVGIILGRCFERSDEAWEVYCVWSDTWGGQKGRNHDRIMHEAFYEISQQRGENELGIATIVKAATDNGWAPKRGDAKIEHFVFYVPGNNFIYTPTREYCIAAGVDATVDPVNVNGKIVPASKWIKRNAAATSLAYEPSIGEGILKGHDCCSGEIKPIEGGNVFNMYQHPHLEPGDAKLARPFVEHCHRLFNKDGDADQFMNYMAHRVQKPWEKPRFALLIAGEQGTGKDAAINLCAPAIGEFNIANIEPSAFEKDFNEFVTKTLVRISEAANKGEMNRWVLNERMKTLIAGSPDYVMANPKFGKKTAVRMHCGVVITTNHLDNSVYIPQDDRRYDIIHTASLKEMDLDTPEKLIKYFDRLWSWFYDEGVCHVGSYLAERDLSQFSASHGQRRTEAHKEIQCLNFQGDEWCIDALDEMGNPTQVFSNVLIQTAVTLGEKETDVKRRFSYSLKRLGYHKCLSSHNDGRWIIKGKRVHIFIKNGTNPNVDENSEIDRF